MLLLPGTRRVVRVQFVGGCVGGCRCRNQPTISSAHIVSSMIAFTISLSFARRAFIAFLRDTLDC